MGATSTRQWTHVITVLPVLEGELEPPGIGEPTSRAVAIGRPLTSPALS
jgi:hypothetical protein